jgi:hypothetical protein
LEAAQRTAGLLVLPGIRFESGKINCLAKAIWVAKPTQWGYAQRLLVMCKKEAGTSLSSLQTVVMVIGAVPML